MLYFHSEPEMIACEIAGRLLGKETRHVPGKPGPLARNQAEVHRAFALREAGHTLSRHSTQRYALMSDGLSLWSYGYYEIARWTWSRDFGWLCIFRTGQRCSVTTSKHISGICARPCLPASVETPWCDSVMQL